MNPVLENRRDKMEKKESAEAVEQKQMPNKSQEPIQKMGRRKIYRASSVAQYGRLSALTASGSNGGKENWKHPSTSRRA